MARSGAPSSDTTSARLITVFRRFFKRFGIPEELSCDGGTNLTSQESRGFLDTWRVRLRVSSAHYLQSNGRAEAAVKCCHEGCYAATLAGTAP
ncbi:hypothetical protein GWK47_036810 [Chionoecetes opilio]|uniref:Integrase catalytic domain-containing protein n=1 Tax=Chionoecetes opilio TaxID=41210 RepID=A0A8J5D2J8_CHIOP|nr:hypothetical protein GWK47_036810 [Chionoecetes opilio]